MDNNDILNFEVIPYHIREIVKGFDFDNLKFQYIENKLLNDSLDIQLRLTELIDKDEKEKREQDKTGTDTL